MFLFTFSFRQSLSFYFKKYLAADHPKIGFSSNQRGLFNVNHLTWPLPINGRFSASSICCKIDQKHIFSCRIFNIHRTINLKGNGIQNINNFLLTQTISSTIKQLPTASEFLPMPYKRTYQSLNVLLFQKLRCGLSNIFLFYHTELIRLTIIIFL